MHTWLISNAILVVSIAGLQLAMLPDTANARFGHIMPTFSEGKWFYLIQLLLITPAMITLLWISIDKIRERRWVVGSLLLVGALLMGVLVLASWYMTLREILR